MPEKFSNLVGGEWAAPSSREYMENRNPARWSEVIGLWPESAPEDIDRAVDVAERGFEAWREVPAPQRGLILKVAADLLSERKEELARAMTREMGKVLEETRGDVQEAIDTGYYAATEGRRPFGHTVPSELPEKWAMSMRRPIGVCGIITPFNFPIAVPSWKIFPALLCGNSVVWKPAEDVPHSANLFVEILLEAGVPAGAVQLVHGRGEVVGKALVEHPRVPAISFTGSTEVGSLIGETGGRMHKRVSLEMGGKNAQIVLADADIDLAVDGAVWGAFGTTGQRCTATSRLILHEAVHDSFIDRLVERAQALQLGDGLDEGTDIGPLINQAALEKIESYMEVARDEGVEIACGGRRRDGDGDGEGEGDGDGDDDADGEGEGGVFFEPTVLVGVKAGMRVEQEEIFGPVLSVIKFSDFEEAIRINNGVRYGLSSALYTRDVRSAFRALGELDNGITYINAPTIGAEAHLPFGGVKQTGNGHREGGWEVFDFYTETKVGYVDYSGRLQRAQIDTYE